MALTLRPMPALLLLAVACSRGAPPPPTPSAALDRAGLAGVVGRRVRGDSLPIRGARLVSGWLATPPTDSGATWSLQHLSSRGRDVIVLQRETAREGTLPVWVVTDAGYLPPLPASFRLATNCGYAEQVDPRIFAVARNADTPYLTEARWAWAANLATGRIDTAGTRGLRCENLGYGSP